MHKQAPRLTNRAAAHYGNLAALGGRHWRVDELLDSAHAPLGEVLISCRRYLLGGSSRSRWLLLQLVFSTHKRVCRGNGMRVV